MIAGNTTLMSTPSSFAPAATQARNRATSSFVGWNFAFAGGIVGFSLCSVNSTIKLLSGLPASITLRASLPSIIALCVSRLSVPFCVLALWHSRQYFARNGRMSLE